MGTSALQLSTSADAITSGASASTLFMVSNIPARLDHSNFMLWKTPMVPNLYGANLHGHLDGTTPSPPSRSRGQG
jgi:hypothetical protein